MRKLLALAIAAILCFGLVACKGTESPVNTTSTGGNTTTASSGSTTPLPLEPMTITISRPADSDNLDPIIQNNNVNIWVITLCLEPLLLATENGRDVMPGIAESYDISEDGKTYTFHLYPDLKFGDGTSVTKEDIVWSIERVMNTEESPWTTFYANFASVECPDDQTVVVNMHEVRADDLSMFTLFAGVITKKAHFDEVGPEGYSKGPIGTGPFIFKEWKEGEYMTLAKNPYYRFADQVIADEIKFIVVPDDNTRIMQLQAGETDIMTFVPYNRMKELSDTDGLKAVVIPGTGVTGLMFNCTRAPMDKADVRNALAMAINKQEIVDNVHYGNTQVASSFLPPGLPHSTAGSVTVPQYDPEGAKALLAEAGYPDGFKLTINIGAGNTNQEQIATILNDQFSKVGVDLTIEVMESATLRPLRDKLELDLFIGGWTSDIPDPSQQTRYYCMYEVVESIHTGWQNPDVEALVRQVEVEMDRAKREGLYKQIQQAFADDCPLVPLYYEGYPVAMKDSVIGFVEIPLGNYRFDKLSK